MNAQFILTLKNKQQQQMILDIPLNFMNHGRKRNNTLLTMFSLGEESLEVIGIQQNFSASDEAFLGTQTIKDIKDFFEYLDYNSSRFAELVIMFYLTNPKTLAEVMSRELVKFSYSFTNEVSGHIEKSMNYVDTLLGIYFERDQVFHLAIRDLSEHGYGMSNLLRRDLFDGNSIDYEKLLQMVMITCYKSDLASLQAFNQHYAVSDIHHTLKILSSLLIQHGVINMDLKGFIEILTNYNDTPYQIQEDKIAEWLTRPYDDKERLDSILEEIVEFATHMFPGNTDYIFKKLDELFKDIATIDFDEYHDAMYNQLLRYIFHNKPSLLHVINIDFIRDVMLGELNLITLLVNEAQQAVRVDGKSYKQEPNDWAVIFRIPKEYKTTNSQAGNQNV